MASLTNISDQSALMHVAVDFFGEDPHAWVNDTSPLKQILNDNEIIGFQSDLITLPIAAIQSMTDRRGFEMTLSEKNRFKIVLSLYHEASRENGGPINIALVDKDACDATNIVRQRRQQVSALI